MQDKEMTCVAGSMFGADSQERGFKCEYHHPLYALSELILADCLCDYDHDDGGCLHPEVQAKVQEELNRVVGRETCRW